MMRKFAAIRMAIAISFAPLRVAVAGQYDGSVPLLCVPIEILECEAGGKCSNSTAEGVNLPQFIKVNFKEKTLSAVHKDGPTAPIKHVEREQGRMIMHGGQHGRGWSVVISEETGKMSATVTEDQVGFVIFGACTPL
jgi:hypothetical protein